MNESLFRNLLRFPPTIAVTLGVLTVVVKKAPESNPSVARSGWLVRMPLEIFDCAGSRNLVGWSGLVATAVSKWRRARFQTWWLLIVAGAREASRFGLKSTFGDRRKGSERLHIETCKFRGRRSTLDTVASFDALQFRDRCNES